MLFILCFGRIKSGGNEKMKFTEGYWLPSEKQMHPMQCRLVVEQIQAVCVSWLLHVRFMAQRHDPEPADHHVEFVAYTGHHLHGGMAPQKPTTTKFRPSTKQRAYEDVTVTINEDEAVLDTGSVQVRVQRKGVFAYTFEADGKVLTGSGFRNLPISDGTVSRAPCCQPRIT